MVSCEERFFVKVDRNKAGLYLPRGHFGQVGFDGLHHRRGFEKFPAAGVSVAGFVAVKEGLNLQAFKPPPQKAGQGDLAHVLFPELGQDLGNVLGKEQVRREEDDLISV